MNHTVAHGIAHAPHGANVPPWLIDEYQESYIAWREACAAARHAYELWNAADRADRTLSSAAYGAALDREEQAAAALGCCVQSMRRWLG